MFETGAAWYIEADKSLRDMAEFVDGKVRGGQGNRRVFKADMDKVDYEYVLSFDTTREHLYEAGVELPVTSRIYGDLCETFDAGLLTWDGLKERIGNVMAAFYAELGSIVFLGISEHARHYKEPTAGWNAVIERFACRDDVEEATRCLALERSTAAVFHLMRIVEKGVLELQVFLKDPDDPKAHFGGVLAKLESARKNGFANAPDFLKPNFQFVIEILPHLYAVKDAWRDKVVHVGNNIIPSKQFTGPMAWDIYRATLALMKTLADGLPIVGG